jgi:hypothetical protein
MKMDGNRKVIGLAVCLATTMHLLLFLVVRPANGNGLSGAPVPPTTYYLAHSGDTARSGQSRTVWSPVLFSLPSELGFSHDLLEERPHTGLTFKQPNDKESFLHVDGASTDDTLEINTDELLVTSGGLGAPRPPVSAVSVADDRRPAPRRVYMAPELKERLMGGIVLPPELNRRGAGDAAWEVRADLRVSEQGTIHHVLFEQPLSEESLNLAVLRLLYGLRFKAGEGPVDGRIEIYSPEATPDGGATP